MTNVLTGKVALVTGSGRGIGRAIALELVARGATVVIDYPADDTQALELQREIENRGGRALALRADVSDAAQIQNLIETIYAKLKRLDILVNNAGIEKEAAFVNVTPEDFDRVLAVDLRAVFFLTQLAVRRWLSDGTKGKIINISSVHRELPFPGYSPYAIAKGGVGMLTRTLAVELGPHGITVNAIAPGAIATDINRDMREDPRRRQALEQKIPLRRMGTPEDVAKLAAWLAGPDSDYVTASTYYVDGGLLWNYEE
jgi:glucose 1-dehydrogenase